jgi:hypothetical protein
MYIDKVKDLMDMPGYMDPITIVLKFCRGLNVTTQDRIAESGTDRPVTTSYKFPLVRQTWAQIVR